MNYLFYYRGSITPHPQLILIMNKWAFWVIGALYTSKTTYTYNEQMGLCEWSRHYIHRSKYALTSKHVSSKPIEEACYTSFLWHSNNVSPNLHEFFEVPRSESSGSSLNFCSRIFSKLSQTSVINFRRVIKRWI